MADADTRSGKSGQDTTDATDAADESGVAAATAGETEQGAPEADGKWVKELVKRAREDAKRTFNYEG